MKNIVVTALFVVISLNVFSCDVCGGGAVMSGLGFLPNSDFHFVGLTYRHRTYTTEHPTLFDSEPVLTGANRFQTAEFWGRYTLSERVQILGFIPVHNKYIDDQNLSEPSSISGLGDISVLANYQVVKNKNLRCFLGAGIKLPTGDYRTNVDRFFIPNMQIGTGSLDALFTANLTYFRNKWGLNTEVNRTLTTTNSQNYRFGNATEASLLGLYRWQGIKSLVIPQLGLSYQYIDKNTTNVTYNFRDPYSRTNLLSTAVGLDHYRGNFGVRFRYNIPLVASIADGYVTPQVNAQAQVIYIINNTSKDTEQIKK